MVWVCIGVVGLSFYILCLSLSVMDRTSEFIKLLREILEVKAVVRRVRLCEIKVHIGETELFRRLFGFYYAEALCVTGAFRYVESLSVSLESGVVHDVVVDSDLYVIDGYSRVQVLKAKYAFDREREVMVKVLPVSCTESPYSMLVCAAVMLKTMRGKFESPVLKPLYENMKRVFSEFGINLDMVVGVLDEGEEDGAKIVGVGAVAGVRAGKFESPVQRIVKEHEAVMLYLEEIHCRVRDVVGVSDAVLEFARGMLPLELYVRLREDLSRLMRKFGRKVYKTFEVAAALYLAALKASCFGSQRVVRRFMEEVSRMEKWITFRTINALSDLLLRESNVDVDYMFRICVERIDRLLEEERANRLTEAERRLVFDVLRDAYAGGKSMVVTAAALAWLLRRGRISQETVAEWFGINKVSLRLRARELADAVNRVCRSCTA